MSAPPPPDEYVTSRGISEEQKAREREAYATSSIAREALTANPHRYHWKRPLADLERNCLGCLEQKLTKMEKSRDGFMRTAAKEYRKKMRESRDAIRD